MVVTVGNAPIASGLNTVLHELAHQACYDRGFYDEHHGDHFRSLYADAAREILGDHLRLVGKALDTTHDLDRAIERAIRAGELAGPIDAAYLDAHATRAAARRKPKRPPDLPPGIIRIHIPDTIAAICSLDDLDCFEWPSDGLREALRKAPYRRSGKGYTTIADLTVAQAKELRDEVAWHPGEDGAERSRIDSMIEKIDKLIEAA